MNKRSLFFVFTMVFGICFFSLVSFVQISEAKPVAFVENKSHDFGTVFEGADVTYDYVIRNNGDSDLEILSVKSG